MKRMFTQFCLKKKAISKIVFAISKNRSRDTNRLAIPRSFSKFGDRRFSVSGPRLWNDLSNYIKNAKSLTQFKTLLKTYFFTQVFVEA